MFGDLVRGHRRRLSLSQTELATHSGLSVRGLRKIESGQVASPQPATVRLLADALDLHGDDRADLLRAAASPSTAQSGGPAQLPAVVEPFTGRTAAIATLDAATSRVVTIVGTAGVGKTTLAVHWSHRVRHRFPDGQLYVDLRSFHPTGSPVCASAALQRFLTALGVAPQFIPAEVDAQSDLYRTLLADRRVLVVLDNARDCDQIRPLLPGSAGCFTLVTSRNGLTGLIAAEGAQVLRLDVPDADEARQLLLRRLGPARLGDDPAAADRIVASCARLPLALAIAAARAAETPSTPLAVLADELSEPDARLDALSTGEPTTDLRVVFRRSYRMLRPAAATLFRLLGLHTGADISVAAAADLGGLTIPPTASILADLTRANLLSEQSPGRYSFHDLLHAYAAERTRDEDSTTLRRDAAARLFDYYLRHAEAAVHLLYPGEQRLDRACQSPGAAFGSMRAARNWLDAERANLVAAASNRTGDNWHARASALAAVLRPYFDGGYYTDGLIVHALAREAAREQGDLRAEATALNNLGSLNRRGGRISEAGELHRQALVLARQVDDSAATTRSLRELGIVHWRTGDYEQSRQYHQAALDLYRVTGDRHGEALQLNFFGIGHRQAGEYEQAVTFHRAALAVARDLGHPIVEADVLDTLGIAYQRTEAFQSALTCHQRALAIFQDLGHRAGEANALHNLGCALQALNLAVDAVNHHQRALRIYRDIGERCFEVEAINGLAAAQLANGDIGAAIDSFTAALRQARHHGDRHESAKASEGIAAIHYATGEPDYARQHWQQAHDIYTQLGLPDADRVGHHL